LIVERVDFLKDIKNETIPITKIDWLLDLHKENYICVMIKMKIEIMLHILNIVMKKIGRIKLKK